METASDATGTADMKFLIDSAATPDYVMDSRQRVDTLDGSAGEITYYGTDLINKGISTQLCPAGSGDG